MTLLFNATGENTEQVTEALQQNLNSIAHWYSCNKLQVNADKSYSMLIKGKEKVSNMFNVNLDGTAKKQVSDVRYLVVQTSSG